MKRILIFLSLLAVTFHLDAQEIPDEWRMYNRFEHMFNIQSDYRSKNVSITEFSRYLTDIARTELAKQIELGVKDVASINKESVNGFTNVTYSSTSVFSTNVQLSLVKTDTRYDENTGKVYAIAYINKKEVLNYETSSLSVAVSDAGNRIRTAEDYYSKGFKKQADEELAEALRSLENAGNSLSIMTVMGASQSTLDGLSAQVNVLGRRIKALLSEHSHATCVNIRCSADCMGQSYPALVRMIKGELSESGCSFVQDDASADWTIVIEASAEEYNSSNVGGNIFYYSNAGAFISINKNITSQCVFEDNIECRGGAVTGYLQAAKKAYEHLADKIGTTIKQTINL